MSCECISYILSEFEALVAVRQMIDHLCEVEIFDIMLVN